MDKHYLLEEAIMEDIQTLSVDMAQSRVREEAAARVENMIIDSAKEQGDTLADLMESARVVTDPTLAQNIDLLA
jgi:urease gamma subunit